ncbi:MAG: hypothetical protein AVO39_11095 [delta proteobacterium MLS_D]|nr:MAG: hypothetical protein AVO39_11095 [delta proteobacterium MLS_D]
MADITSPQAVRFSNEKIRPAAERMAQLYTIAKQVVDEWYATNMGTEIPVSADLIIDGSANDGRTPINGNDATLVISRLQEFVTDMEANNNAKLNTVLKPAVNALR